MFVFDKKSSSPSDVTAAQKFVMRLKTLRYPHILRFIDSTELPDSIYVVTEPVKALNLDHDGAHLSEDSICLGLFQITVSERW